jgi:uncharacterized protein (DUF1697 family)
MKTWIALLRGVNVGGNGSLPMKGLRDLLEELGHTNVTTYIQSGNCIFQSENANATKISESIAVAVEGGFGFKPAVITLSLKDLDAALEDNPFPQGADDLKSVHVFFLCEAADKSDMASLKALCEGDEAVELIGKRLYTYTPAGIGRSKMASKIGKFVPVEMTARNLRSVGKIAELERQAINLQHSLCP